MCAVVTLIRVTQSCGLISAMAEGHGDDKRVAMIISNLLICETFQEFLDGGLTARGSTVIDLLRGRYASRRWPEAQRMGGRAGTGGRSREKAGEAAGREGRSQGSRRGLG